MSDLKDLLKQQGILLKKIMDYHRDVTVEKKDFFEVDLVNYNEDSGILSIVIPEVPPTTKMFSRRLRGSGFDEVHNYYSSRWYNHIRQVKEHVEKHDRTIKPYKDALVFIKFMEADAILRDCDNYSLYLVHNALVHNLIIEDDNFQQMQYIYNVSGSINNYNEATSITIIENDGAWVRGSFCQGCILNNQIRRK